MIPQVFHTAGTASAKDWHELAHDPAPKASLRGGKQEIKKEKGERTKKKKTVKQLFVTFAKNKTPHYTTECSPWMQF